MNIHIFTKAFLCASMLCIASISLSCSQNKDEQVLLTINRLSANAENSDSLRAIHSKFYDNGEKKLILDAIADSSINLKALALATIFKPEEIADYVLKHPSIELISHIQDTLLQIDEGEFSAFATILSDKFNSLSAEQQAEFVTVVASPEDCAANLEPGDDELRNKILKIYRDSSDISAIERFNGNIK
jgi:hypothetical protein